MMDVFGNSGNNVFKSKGAGNDVFKQKGVDIWNKREVDPLTHRDNPTEDVFKNKENDIFKHRNQDVFKNKNVQFNAFPNDTDHEHIVRDRTVMPTDSFLGQKKFRKNKVKMIQRTLGLYMNKVTPKEMPRVKQKTATISDEFD